jgi:hypothetical protein
MSTQPYSPQPGALPRSGKFAPAQGAAEIIAIAAIPGEMAPSEFGPSEVRYRLVDGRSWYVPQIIADELNARVAPRQQFEVLRFGRGKTDLRIVPLPPFEAPAPPAYEAPPAQPPAQRVAAPVAAPPPITPQSQRFMAAYKDAIDVLLEARAYAQRQGLALEIRCEDVRCLAATVMIDAKGCR